MDYFQISTGKMKYRIFIAMLSFCLLALINGCSEEMRGQFGGMFELRGKLVKEYNHNNIHINISNGRFLGISFINSQFNDLKVKEMEEKAREIALFSVSALEKTSKIEKVAVAFTVHETKFLIVNYNNSLNTFLFEVPELREELGKQDDKQPEPDKSIPRG